jgi:hypothetical protein
LFNHLLIAMLALALAGAAVPAPAWSRQELVLKDRLAQLAKQENPTRLARLEEMVKAEKLPCEIQEFKIPRKDAPELTGRNLVIFAGAPPKPGSRLMVLGAHYDTVRMADGTMSEGAYDNGAAVLTLLEVAKTLRTLKLAHPVQIVFFDHEETGLFGSTDYARRLGKDRIAVDITLDIAAWGDTLMFGSTSDARSASLHQTLREVCVQQHVRFIEFPRIPASDQVSFEKAEIPTVLLAVAPELDAHQFWLYSHSRKGLDPKFVPAPWLDMHHAGDQVARVDPKTTAMVHNTVISLLLELDGQR